eukprot:jgi/Tetstr1/465068/TSEL_009796.t1
MLPRIAPVSASPARSARAACRRAPRGCCPSALLRPNNRTVQVLAPSAARTAHPRQPRPRRVRASASTAVEAQPSDEVRDQGWGPVGVWRRHRAWWREVLDDDEADEDAAAARTKRDEAATVLLKIWHLVQPDRGLLFGAFGLLTLAALVELGIPHFVAKSIFAATKDISSERFQYYITMLLACCTGYAVFAGLRGVCFAFLNMRLVQRMRAEVFRSIIRRELEFFDEEEVGTLTSRLGADCQSIARLIGFHINVMLRNFMQCIGGGIYLFVMSPPLAFACGAVTALLWVVTLWYSDLSRQLTRVGQDALADSTQVAEEVFTLARTVRTFGTEEQEVARYKSSLQRIIAIATRYCLAYAMFLTSSSFLFNATKVVTLACGGIAALKGVITPEQLTAFILYVEFVTTASIAVCEQYASVMEAVGSTQKVVELMETPGAAQLAAGKQPASCAGLLELRGVGYRYPTRPDPPALQGINLTIRPGQLTAIPGTKALSTTIAANIGYGVDATREELVAAARLSNADEFITQLPEGYDTRVTSNMLSGGQKQRIVIARALVRDPALLLLDEATSALDAESETLVQATLDGIMEESQGSKAVVVIAHRLSTVRNAQQIVVMNKGQIAEIGDHETLLMRRGIYWELVQRQEGGLDMAERTVDDEDGGLEVMGFQIKPVSSAFVKFGSTLMDAASRRTNPENSDNNESKVSESWHSDKKPRGRKDSRKGPAVKKDKPPC